MTSLRHLVLNAKIVGEWVGDGVQEASRTLLTVPFSDSMNPNTSDLKKLFKEKSQKITMV